MNLTPIQLVRFLPFVALAAIFFITGCASTGSSTTTTTETKKDRTKSSMYAR